MQLKCAAVTSAEDLQACLALRKEVFVREQNVLQSLETDGLDEAARHFAVWAGERIVATARVRFMGSAAKIERVAVLRDFRGMGCGAFLMKYIMQEVAAGGNVRLFKLNAQVDSMPFYEKLGFKKHGPEFLDAGIPHYAMVCER
jgi:predicted GNAT family N-acyltransferase